MELSLIILLFMVADVWFYAKAPYERRSKSFIYKMVGGGFAAYFISDVYKEEMNNVRVLVFIANFTIFGLIYLAVGELNH